mmetsp:Transcript_31918/g.57231  ORF Transcript_31918/g.57231 Transcript_31918/m.57231 type:complete len:80 (-) Transcript_31918:90-329(-)
MLRNTTNATLRLFVPIPGANHFGVTDTIAPVGARPDPNPEAGESHPQTVAAIAAKAAELMTAALAIGRYITPDGGHTPP